MSLGGAWSGGKGPGNQEAGGSNPTQPFSDQVIQAL